MGTGSEIKSSNLANILQSMNADSIRAANRYYVQERSRRSFQPESSVTIGFIAVAIALFSLFIYRPRSRSRTIVQSKKVKKNVTANAMIDNRTETV